MVIRSEVGFLAEMRNYVWAIGAETVGCVVTLDNSPECDIIVADSLLAARFVPGAEQESYRLARASASHYDGLSPGRFFPHRREVKRSYVCIAIVEHSRIVANLKVSRFQLKLQKFTRIKFYQQFLFVYIFIYLFV